MEDEIEANRVFLDKFDKRKSGADYRGELNATSNKPEGKGFKVYPNGSVYEGFFEDGQTHG